MHIEVVTFTATAPGAAGAAAAAVAGDSMTIKNAQRAAGVGIISLWQKNQVAGFGQIITPSGHDTTRGYRISAPLGVNIASNPLGVRMPMQPQETISALIAGSAVGGDVEQMSALIWYGDLPGIDARLITAAQAESRIEELTTVNQAIVSTAGPGYSGEALINSASDLLRANRDYAVLGLTCATDVHAVTLKGPDLGNVRIAAPGASIKSEITSQFFMLQSRANGMACVPVINSGNKGATFLGVAADENAGTFNVSLILGLLK